MLGLQLSTNPCAGYTVCNQKTQNGAYQNISNFNHVISILHRKFTCQLPGNPVTGCKKEYKQKEDILKHLEPMNPKDYTGTCIYISHCSFTPGSEWSNFSDFDYSQYVSGNMGFSTALSTTYPWDRRNCCLLAINNFSIGKENSVCVCEQPVLAQQTSGFCYLKWSFKANDATNCKAHYCYH